MYRLASTVFLLSLTWPPGSPLQAEIFTPGQSVPQVSGDIFGWDSSNSHRRFASWSRFNDFPGGPATGAFGFLPPGTSPAPQDSFFGTSDVSTLTFLSGQTLPSSGNAYGGLFGPGDASSLRTDAFAVVKSGQTGGNFTRVVAQWDTIGSELDRSTVLLSPSSSAEGTIAPSFAIETSREPFASRGGFIVSYLALWDINGAQDEYRIDFEAVETNMSIDNFRVDSLTQATAFVTPTAVPEPSSLAVLAIGVVACAAGSYRKKQKSLLHASIQEA